MDRTVHKPGGEPLVVGFDLDMTLADTRRGIAAVFRALSADTGVPIDADLAVSRLGPPLEWELAHWFPDDRVEAAAEGFRALYADLAVPATDPMPGAAEAVAAVRRRGYRAVVVTAKKQDFAELTLAHLGIEVDEVVGWCWRARKGAALAERGARIYVGDHPHDVDGARVAGALAVIVGDADADPDVRLPDLHAFPGWLAEHLLTERLRALGSVLVAFSGGADSAFLLAAAVRALGADRVAAATAVSPSLPAAELDQARAYAASLGVRHLTPATHEDEHDGYRANAGDRCYFCKAELLDVLAPLAAEHGLATVATGTNADDAVAGFRPGIRAAAERGAATPLLDAGLTKAEVREISRRWDLPTWDKPAAACLASRVAYGIEVTPARLARVERAETALRAALTAAGLHTDNLRVRDLGDRARVEVDAALTPALAARPDLLAAVEGFSAVEVDSRGFRSGAMNELLADPGRWR